MLSVALGDPLCLGGWPLIKINSLHNNIVIVIYHWYNHYFLIIGYESNPNLPIEAYLPAEELSDTEEWIVIGEISKKFAPFHIK